MRDHKSSLAKLTRLLDEFEAANRSVINPEGGRNREALMRLADAADEMARIHEEEATELRRVAREAFDLSITK
ncbi:hypothetical protein OG439_40325 [Amycolatopsis sp. NBC_01307]|uniref:hypothetical protein n=1 Tax=Amycolatopsis sp. NBC_01307 TaxID=2903561 RepID=UPI002E13EDC1|nr:hypothetical protein OG439_40325 [Amycolatopsis sp. NBC_01307]